MLVVAVFALASCATSEQLKKTLHDGVDIGFSVLDDGKTIYKAAKDLVTGPASPAKP